MKPVFVSTYCVGYEDFDLLEKLLDSIDSCPVGVEFAVWASGQQQLPDHQAAEAGRFAGIPCTLHSPFYELCTADGSPEQREKMALYKEAVHQYRLLGAHSMVVHTNEGHFEKEHGQKLCVQKLLELHDYLKPLGVSMTVENVGYPLKGNVLFDQKEFTELFDLLPEDIGALLDTGHAMLNRWNQVQLIHDLGSRIRGYHLNNNDGEHDCHYPCFDPRGFTSHEKMEKIISTAAEVTPDADMIVEYAPGIHITPELLNEELRRISAARE